MVRPVWALETGDCFGDVAQLGEHLLCKQGVVGSNPIVSISMVDRQLSVVRSWEAVGFCLKIES